MLNPNPKNNNLKKKKMGLKQFQTICSSQLEEGFSIFTWMRIVKKQKKEINLTLRMQQLTL